MTRLDYFPTGDEDILGQRYVSAAINMTMLRDHCVAQPFLRQAAADVPEFAPELSRAADLYAEVARLRERMDALISDNFSPPALKAIRYAGIRQDYATLILQIREIVELIAKFLFPPPRRSFVFPLM